MALSQFGQAFLSSLEENRPQEYQRLKASGQLSRLASEVDERAQGQFEDLLSQLQKQNPGPKDFIGRAQHLSTLESQARELVLDEVLVRDPETEQAENPPPDPSPEQVDRESAKSRSDLQNIIEQLTRSNTTPGGPRGGTTG